MKKKRGDFYRGQFSTFNLHSQIHCLSFHRKKKKNASRFFPWNIFSSAIFDFHFRENPHFHDIFQALILNGRIAVANVERFRAMWNGRQVCCVHQIRSNLLWK